MGKKGFAIVTILALVIQLLYLPFTASAEAKITWGEVKAASYEPLQDTIMMYKNELYAGGYDLLSQKQTNKASEADFVINIYSEMGGHGIIELNEGLNEPTDSSLSSYATELKIKKGGIYLVVLHDGSLAKIRIDQIFPTKVMFSYVLETSSAEKPAPLPKVTAAPTEAPNQAQTVSKRIALQLDNKKARVNGKASTIEVAPFILDGRTMVPLRFISEGLGAQVEWDEIDRRVTLRMNGETVVLWIEKSEAKVNGKAVSMDVPAKIIDGNTMVPVRFVSENLKQVVTFLEDTKQIIVTTPSSGRYNNGVPDGSVNLNLPDGATFVGEAKTVKGKLIGYGTICYANGDKSVGQFVDGKPSGMNTLILADNSTYLIEFKNGTPVKVYKTNRSSESVSKEVEAYQTQELKRFYDNTVAKYQAQAVEPFQADGIEVFQADDIEVFQAQEIEVYKASLIEKFEAEAVELQSSAVTIDAYVAESVELRAPTPTDFSSVSGSSGPDYSNPLVQAWTSHMISLPYIINNGFRYSY